MAYLNGEWFENDLVNPPGKGEINFESGYKAERLAGQHIPPDGWYWLFLSNRTRQQTKDSDGSWLMVECRGLIRGISKLRSIHYLRGTEMHLDWFDFTHAHWIGPIDMPAPPAHRPQTSANRL